MTSQTDLTDLQLQIVMYLSNGMTFDEVAHSVDRSLQNVKKHTMLARQKTGAKTVPHLVSIVIAHGQLEWTPEGRTVTDGFIQH